MDYIGLLGEFIFSPLGIIGTFASAALMSFGLRNRALLPYFVVLPLFVSCFGKYRYITASYTFPLEQILNLSRPIFVVSLSLFVPICLFFLPQASSRKPHPASLWLLAFQLVYSFRMIGEGDSEFGYLALATYVLGFIAIYLLRGALPSDKESAGSLFCQAFSAAGVLFATACTYQYLTNPSAAYWAGRFIGITNNSSHTGEFAGWFFISTITVLLSLIAKGKRVTAFLVSPILLVYLAIIFATGSRTALVLLSSGVLVLLRNRLGAFVIPLIMAPIGLVLATQYFGDFDGAISHMTSGSDSRTQLFSALWSRFLESPMFGQIELVEGGRIRIRESSYLSAAANLGLLGLTPLIAAVCTYIVSARKAVAREKLLRKHLIFSDWALAIIVSALTAAIFEGFLFAIVGPAALLMHIGFSLVDSPIYESNVMGKHQ